MSARGPGAQGQLTWATKHLVQHERRGGERKQILAYYLGKMAANRLDLQRSGLHDHKQVGKELIPPFNQLSPGTEQIFWLRDLLPEFLWIDALVHEYGEGTTVRVFNEFLTAADAFNPDERLILDGTVGAFRRIPQDGREALIRKHADEVNTAVVQPFGHVLSLYPECPMKWMAPELTPGDRGTALAKVREAVVRLFPGKDPHPGLCRALPLNRFFAHNKVRIFSSLTETIKAIKTYPHGDRYRAETFAGTTHNMMLMQQAERDPNTFAWARSFWNSNLTIAACVYD